MNIFHEYIIFGAMTKNSALLKEYLQYIGILILSLASALWLWITGKRP